MKKLIVLLALVTSIFAALGAAAAGYVAYSVFLGDYSHLSRDRILEILSKETVVVYDDGESQVGSLFGGEHRHYVPFQEIPQDLKDAVLAAEDDSFYRHVGIDFVSTMRAVFVNIAFSRREGASTITQQTVKNLYGRPVTNLSAKYFEMINAFKMERSYKKDEILEFYLNQFHVTGNGRGAGVAAKYYFDKEVSELTLVEAAFIAGSVKGPALYDPFKKRSIAAREQALQRAQERKNYVLGRMLELGMIAQSEHETAKNAKIPFSQGRFQFNQLSVIDLVKGQLGRAEVLEALGAENVDQIANMGLKVTTTLNHTVQEHAQYGVRQNLSRIETVLNGFSPAKDARPRNLSKLLPREFYVGEVAAVDATPNKEQMRVSFGLAQCYIDSKGIDRIAKFIDFGRWKGIPAAKESLLAKLPLGSPVMISVKEEIQHSDAPPSVAFRPDGSALEKATSQADQQNTMAGEEDIPVGDEPPVSIDNTLHAYLCDLEVKPALNGGAIAIDKGEIMAVVGGFSPHEYNRAIYARRQPGSTFKTLTYYAALHLGWTALDPLLNIRDAYLWQGNFYYPRPDHEPKTLTTTFIGAGSFSENLASVWLLSHLTRKLTPGQFRELLVSLEVTNGTESEDELAKKMLDRFNVRFRTQDLEEGVLSAVIDEYSSELGVLSSRDLYMTIMTLNYGGQVYENEIMKIARRRDKSAVGKEAVIRGNMLRNNLTRWNRLSKKLTDDLAAIEENSESQFPSDIASIYSRFRITGDGRLVYFGEDQRFDPTSYSNLLAPLAFRESSRADIENAIDGFLSASGPSLANDVWLDGYMPVGLLNEMSSIVNERLLSLAEAPVSEKLYWNFDLRYSVGMLFSRNLVQEMGVVSDLSWVPSFPLGANDVSLAELAMAYQTLLTGETYQFFQDDSVNQLSLIRRIEDSAGNLLWEVSPNSTQAFDRFYSSSILSILRGTMTHGTARSANALVLADGGDEKSPPDLQKMRLHLPMFGKTGTTNDYTNATFVGMIPYPESEGVSELSPKDAITIAAYVGYDGNKPMKRSGVRIAGGTGALPAWIEIANAIVREKQFSTKIPWQDYSKEPRKEVAFDYGSTETVQVSVHSSVIVGAEVGSDVTSSETILDPDEIQEDYKDPDVPSIFVSLPGSVSQGVFRSQSKVSFPKARDGIVIPQDIPTLDVEVEGLKPLAPLEEQEEGSLASSTKAEGGESTVPDEGVQEAEDDEQAAAGADREQVIPDSSNDQKEPDLDSGGFRFLIPPPPPAGGSDE